LEGFLEPIHANELARLIFDIHSDADLERAKSSLTARLSKGVKRGYFRAAGAGRYARIDG
jgi:hypothetical protein